MFNTIDMNWEPPTGCSTSGAWPLWERVCNSVKVQSCAQTEKYVNIKKKNNNTRLELSTLVSGFYKPVPNTASPTSLWICGLATTNNDFMAERSQCGNPSQPLPGGMHSLPSNAPVCVHVMGCWFSCMANDEDVETHPKGKWFKLSGKPRDDVPFADYMTPFQTVQAARRQKNLERVEPRRGVWNSCCLHFVQFFQIQR